MEKKVLAIYDMDPCYGERFAEFVNRREQVPFEVVAFTALERLKEYALGRQIELLLINAGVGQEEIEKLGAAQVVTLADGEVVPVREQYPSVYKYQAADQILREVMALYCENPDTDALTVLGSKAQVIGIYSPVNRCLKTSLALTMGQLLAKESKVLYLNLESCSGFGRLLGEEYKGDLSELLYFYTQEGYSWVRMASIIHTWGDLDYIPPARYAEDICQLGEEELAGFLSRIAQESPYEFLVADLGQIGRCAPGVLEACGVIYMPVKEDCVSAAKIEEFEEYLISSGHEGLKGRIQKLKLPYHSSFGRSDNYLEQLLWGELGDYTRKLLRRQP